MVYQKTIGGLPKHTKTIKIDVRTWNSLKNRKNENETFDDVIKTLLNQRTKEIGNKKVKAIKYERKTLFLKTRYGVVSIGLEFEYNDIKNQQSDFVLDLKIKKVFFRKKSVNPSIFFGLTHEQKHLSEPYLNLYLRCIALALEKEFRVLTRMHSDQEFVDIAMWKHLYYQYNLSMESFTHDIEDPLNLSEDEKQTEREKKSIKESISSTHWRF